MNDFFQQDDKSLIAAFIRNDEKAFEKIYQLYYQKLLGSIIKMVKSEDLAKELLQNIFIKLWKARHNIDAEKSFSGYLFQIAQNEVYDFFRSVARDNKMRAQLVSNYVDKRNNDTALEKLEKYEADAEINRLIDKLPPRRRLVFQLIKLEKLSYEEVSQKLSISKPTINDHIVKATKFLKEQVAIKSICLLSVFLFY